MLLNITLDNNFEKPQKVIMNIKTVASKSANQTVDFRVCVQLEV